MGEWGGKLVGSGVRPKCGVRRAPAGVAIWSFFHRARFPERFLPSTLGTMHQPVPPYPIIKEQSYLFSMLLVNYNKLHANYL